jgi:hypothetical protein
MSGSKTRFGYSGGSDPPDPEEIRAARTVFGRDVHLRADGHGEVPAPCPPVAATPVPPAPSPAPPAWTALPRDIEFADENPHRHRQRHGKSRLARFLGRWTKSGRFLSKSQLNADAADDVEIPRDTTGRNVLVVLLVALLAFAVTFAVVKLRQRPAAAPAAPTPPAAAATPTPATPPAPPAAAPVPPSATAPPPLAPTSPPTPVPDKPVPAAARGLGSPAPAARPRRPARLTGPSARPPEHLKNDLLPLGE